MKDCFGKDLEVGAMYCCVVFSEEPDGEDSYRELVRFVGVRDGKPVLVDADTWDEPERPYDYDTLRRQAATIVDPKTKGWEL